MAAALSLAYTATPLAIGAKLVVFAAKPQSQGVNFVPPSEYKQILVSASAAASPADILAAYVAKYGALIVGQKIFTRSKVIGSTGLVTAVIEATAIVA